MKHKAAKVLPVHVSLAKKAWSEFARFLRDKGLRLTQAREIMCRQVLAHPDHFCAEHLVEELSAGKNKVSRGTVYRTLELMLEAGMIRKIHDTDAHAHYENIYGRPEHEHMICERCGCFIEFRAVGLSQSVQAQCRACGFRERTHRLTVTGVCRTCSAEENRHGV